MISIKIQLVGGNDDRSFNVIQVDNKILYVDLKKKIKSVTFVPIDFQELHFRGEHLPVVERPIQDIKFGEEIVVKHSLLETWRMYLMLCDSANDTEKEKSERTMCAQSAIDNSKRLEDSGFFLAYFNFVTVWIDTIGEMMRLVDRTQDAFEQSATRFFTKKFPNSTLKFNPKQGGSRAGIVVTVTWNGEETTYYMKTYHRAGSTISRQNELDLREMFAYRLLEVIGVGPVVFFPFYDGPTNIHYIATEEVEEFKELDKIDDVVLQKKLVVEVYLLSLILGIRDLHEGNIGSTREKALSIIDFYVVDTDNFQRRRILDDLKNKSNVGDLGKVREILTEIEYEERMKIAKDALPNWSRINSITIDIIGVEIKELQELGTKYRIGTDDVESYLEDIKFNYDSICLAFQ
ncbi:hypothetical protein GCK72_011114 [Caenorhabditis remanei]|uniref:Uncharacterized protein n=1 Tax=Caenorhabditis remanei TaxID=31234 RepID=A0A6A5H7K9_CAERE|nr:hypothetical protein GCK72_011114 [Caenorhabditis remanei]KAF1762851.1 hypothetical protein GCK72_011114 [Caenorhabditis remanei]